MLYLNLYYLSFSHFTSVIHIHAVSIVGSKIENAYVNCYYVLSTQNKAYLILTYLIQNIFFSVSMTFLTDIYFFNYLTDHKHIKNQFEIYKGE